jgi:hypothetical protein
MTGPRKYKFRPTIRKKEKAFYFYKKRDLDNDGNQNIGNKSKRQSA